jgi:hypothetical protein
MRAQTSLRVAALLLLLGFGNSWTGRAFAQERAANKRTAPAGSQTSLAGLSAKARKLYEHVRRRPSELHWQQIPWLADLPEAFRLAKAENRPILLWGTDDDPLDRC